MNKLLFVPGLLLLCIGCASPRPIVVERVDTIHETKTDYQVVRDSVFFYNSITDTIKGDTIYRLEIRYRDGRKTIGHDFHDTIYTERVKQVPVYVSASKKIKLTYFLYGVVFLAALSIIFIVLKNVIRNIRKMKNGVGG